METHCETCQRKTIHNHLHNAAHGIPGTHMVGTERWECQDCGTATYANSGSTNPDFIFVLDKPPTRVKEGGDA